MPTQPLQSSQQPPSQKWLSLVIVIGFVVLVGGGILGYQYLWTLKATVPAPVIEIPQDLRAKQIRDGVIGGWGIYYDEATGWEIYSNRTFGFEFSYPNLYTLLSIRPAGDFQSIGFFGNPATILRETDKPVDGFSVFIGKRKNEESFDEYLAREKQRSLEIYRAFTEKEPSPSETEILLDNQRGIILKGYGWDGDSVYVPFPDEQNVLVFAKTHATTDSIFDQILPTFRFLQTEWESVTVFSPNEGDKWIIGKTYQIQWDRASLPGEAVDIILRDTSIPTASLSKVWQKEQIQNTGIYDFTVLDFVPGNQYQIYISNQEGQKRSGLFSIVSP